MAKKQISKVANSQMPVGVQILSVLGYIGAVFTLVAGIFLLAGAGFIASMISEILPVMIASKIGAGLFVFLGIFFIACAVLDYFIARGLWKGQEWSRIVMLVLLAVSLISSLAHPIRGLLMIIIDAFLIWYLGFNEKVKKAFN